MAKKDSKAAWEVDEQTAIKWQAIGYVCLFLSSASAIGVAIYPDPTAAVFSALAAIAGTALTLWTSQVNSRRSARDIAAARSGSAEANQRADDARRELERYRAPRTISDDKAAKIRQGLSGFSGQKFSGLVAQSAPDAFPLWTRIQENLRSAGWYLEKPRGLAVGDPPAGVPLAPSPGITIFTPLAGSEASKQAATDLYGCLNSDGLVVRMATHREQDREEVIVIEVGSRPL